MLLFLVLLGGALLLFQVGRATVVQAEVVTAADAAALAAAEDVKAQIVEHLQQTMFNEGAPLDAGRARGAAARYAGLNGGVVRDLEIERIGDRVRVSVVVVSDAEHRLDGSGGLPETAGMGGRSTATAEVQIAFAFGAGGGTGLPTTSGGSCRLGAEELAAAAKGAGLRNVPPGSALRRYSGCGTPSSPGVSVAGMAPAMRVSILRLERALGGPLQINSGYRHPAYQAILCQRVKGPCAPPGRSMHNIGLAIDAGNYGAVAAAVNRDPSIGLCQPLPANDAVHFSHVTGRECGGNAGTLGKGQLFGGDMASFATFRVRLVE